MGGGSDLKIGNIGTCLNLLKRLNKLDFYFEDDYKRFLNKVYRYVEEKYEDEIEKIEENAEEFFDQEPSIDKGSKEIKNDIDRLLDDLSYSLES